MKLKAPQGVGAASFGGVCYPVVKGFVTVPDEAVATFLELGFQVVEEAQGAPPKGAQAGKPALSKPKTGT